jgi:hypothetical protein
MQKKTLKYNINIHLTSTFTFDDILLPTSLVAVQLNVPFRFLLIFCRYRSLVVPSGTLGPVHIKVHCGLHDAVQLIYGIVSPSATVYVVVGGDSVADSGPSIMHIDIVLLYRSKQYEILYVA